MDRRRFLKGIGLLGLATALGVKSAMAQDAPKMNVDLLKAAVQEEMLKRQKDNPSSSNVLSEKYSIDYLVEAFVPSAIYAYVEKKTSVGVETGRNDKYGGTSEFSLDSTLNFLADASVDSNSEITGYTNDSSKIFNFKISALDRRKELTFRHMTAIKFSGRLLDKDISYTLYKSINSELPTRIEGVWNNLDIIVSYTPSSTVKWLVDKADVTLRDIATKKLVAQYLIEYQQGERKVQEGTAIGYKGFTVTKK